ncbi:MAG: NAD-dependent 4,6-dehydratase LegB [Oligoflexales bacterium]
MEQQKVAVTGACGFIGSHLVEQLVQEGFAVKALVYYNSLGTRGWLDTLDKSVLDSVEVVAGDVRDAGCMEAFIDKDIETVYHLASLIAIPYSYQAPQSYIDTNVTGTLNVMKAAQRAGVKKVLHTSTSEVYGTAQFVPITEEHPLQGQSPYSASKIGADQMAWSYFCSFETPVAIARPFNTYGPRQSMRAVIPTMIMQAFDEKEVMSLGAMNPTRDFNFVTDTARGMIAIAQSEQCTGKVVNIGSNFEVSIQETLELIFGIAGREKETKQDSNRMRPDRSEVQRLWADNSRIKELTNWTPEYGGQEGFRRGLERTMEWFHAHQHLYRAHEYHV